jgi:hypothetical protein
MLRRALSVFATTAAAVTILPGTASATPDHAPVDSWHGAGFGASTEVQLEDGRRVNGGIHGYRNDFSEGQQVALGLYITPDSDCGPSALCDEGTGWISVPLTRDQYDFDRNLTQVDIPEMSVTLTRYVPGATMFDPGRMVETPVRISLHFEGIGPVSRRADHSNTCFGDGDLVCQHVDVGATRQAVATVSIDDAHGTAPGQMDIGTYVDAAAPKFKDPGFN